jgi:mRNA-degrading endonuclease RelE of RelBE toxin-antitoxin system
MTKSGSALAIRIEWHAKAFAELAEIDFGQRERIRKTLMELQGLDDPRQRLLPYSGNLKGFWKLRCGDYRLICELGEAKGHIVLIIHVAHRSRAYDKRGERAIQSRSRR